MTKKILKTMILVLFLTAYVSSLSGCSDREVSAYSASQEVAASVVGASEEKGGETEAPVEVSDAIVSGQSPVAIELDIIRSAEVGDEIIFGTYEQDNNISNGQEDITWLVLEKDDSKALIISKYGLDIQPYNNECTSVSWENCSLRKWLNNDFYTTAFNEEEQAIIARTTVTAEANPDSYADQGNDTEDRVFLLSNAEAETFFPSEADRTCMATTYAKAQETYIYYPTGNCGWWLRTSGHDNELASFVNYNGWIESYGTSVSSELDCVRPAVWLSLSSTETQNTTGQQNPDDLPVICVPEIRFSPLDQSDSAFLGTEYLRGQIMTVTFRNTLDGAPDDAVDVSENDDGSILLWGIDCDGPQTNAPDFDTYYDITIAGNGGIRCPESLYGMFAYCEALTEIRFNDCIDTANVTNMSSMFDYCWALRELDLSSFDTSHVTDMSSMFDCCSALSKLDVSGFNTSNVTDMYMMFYGCGSLTELDLSGFNTSNVTSMAGLFCGISVTNLDLSSFDTANVTNMCGMFSDCLSLTELDLSGFNTSNVTDMGSMFMDCPSLTKLDISGFDTSSVVNMNDMFYGCASLTELDVSEFDTSNVTDMGCMFMECSSLTELDVGGFDTSNVVVMWSMFRECSSLTKLDLSSFDTTNVGYMSGMFSGCSALIGLDTSGFIIGEETETEDMYLGVPGYNG